MKKALIQLVAAGSCGLALATQAAGNRYSGQVIEWGGYTMPIVEPGTRFTAVAAGAVHNLALRSDGVVLAWEHNGFHQCDVPTSLTNAVAIAAGYEHSLAVRSDGSLVAWGDSSYGQCRIPPGLSKVIAVAGGHGHSLALKSDGTVVGWGSNLDPAGIYIGQSTPPRGLSNVVAIAAGFFHSLALQADGRVIAWGDNSAGQRNVPPDLTNAVAIAAGGYHNLAVRSDGTVIAWGGSFPHAGQSTFPTNLSGVIAVAAGGYHSLALRNDGTVATWGSNDYGESTVPAGLNGVVALAAGVQHSLALKSDGSLVAWGSSGAGQCVIPSDLNHVIGVAAGCFALPAAIKDDGTVVSLTHPIFSGVSNIVALAPGHLETLALRSDGTVLGWSGYAWATPITNGVAIAAGECHSLILAADGTVITRGPGANYREGLTNVTAIAAGAYHSLVVKSDGTVDAWGTWPDADRGQAAVPLGLSNVVAVAGGGWHSLALKTDGTVVAWGSNQDDAGHHTRQANVPPGLSNVVAIAAGGSHSLALRADGTIVAWGGNYNGEASVPPGLSNVVAIAAGGFYSLALVASPPECVLTCPTNIVVCNDPGQCGASVPFSQPTGTDCEQFTISCFPPPGSFFAVGTNTVLCTAVSPSGDFTNCCTFDIVVVDSERPVISSIATRPEVLWPPDHQMRQVQVKVSATDNCRLARARIVRVTSNEPVSNPRTNPDWRIRGDLGLELRAERSGSGNGRMYSITVECTDDAGNASTAVTYVSVPHSVAPPQGRPVPPPRHGAVTPGVLIQAHQN